MEQSSLAVSGTVAVASLRNHSGEATTQGGEGCLFGEHFHPYRTSCAAQALFLVCSNSTCCCLDFAIVVNCREPKTRINSSHLTVKELVTAKHYLVNFCQHAHFNDDIASLQAKKCLPRESKLLPFSLFVDSNSVLHVGGRQCNTDLAYSQKHPAIIHRRHYLTRLIICSEYLCLLHAEPRLVLSSLSHWFQIIGMKKTV